MSQTTAPGPPPPTASAPRPPLRRSRTDRKLAGVAGGLARYFDVDPLLVRILLVVLTVAAAGTGLVLYLAFVLLVPEEGSEASNARTFVDRHGRLLATIAGIVVVLALCTASGPFGWGSGDGPWWLFLLLAVVAIVWVMRNDRHRAPDFFPPSAEPPAHNGPPATPYPTQAYPNAPYATAVYPTAPYPPVTPTPPWKPRERSALGPLTSGAALVTAGVLVALDRGDVVAVPAVVVLATALAIVGLGLVLGAFVGRSRGLVALGVVLSLVTAIAALVPMPTSRSIGDVEWKPLTGAQVQPSYSWGIGTVSLNLATLDAGTPVSTKVELGVGDLMVLVPRRTVVLVNAHTGAGTIRTRISPREPTLETVDGVDRDLNTVMCPNGVTDGAPTMTLDLTVGLGNVTVERA